MTETRVFVGTSGWVYADWDERFYPKEVKGADRLSYYARHFNTVEVNATFYRTPTQAMIDSWNRRLGSGFHLVVKGPRLVTHLKRLEQCDEPQKVFFDRVMLLTRLKAILWQLPPSLHKDAGRLKRFLSTLPGQVKHAVEFRHASWWDDETATILAAHGAAFVAVSHPRLPNALYPTADFLYVRFHGTGRGLYRYDYSDEELSQWVEVLRPHLPGRVIYAFFNNDYAANAVRNAQTFKAMFVQ
ncbi:MAG: DUF72 domain-containing protein [Desulfomonile sp.]|nr:DUF72 domain-containing protein [Desulfomonile sp.]